jgi:hypothetical protein
VRGPGYTFSAPGGWTTSRSLRALAARGGGESVSVTSYTLLKPYRPERFEAVTKELDGVAAKLATDAGEKVSKSETLTVAGRRIRAYRFGRTRIGFVLDGRREYQLLCRLPASGDDADGACDLLFKSFALQRPV